MSGRGWRSVVTWGALAAFLWPSLSPLPWLLVAAGTATVIEHDRDEDAPATHRHSEDADPPGSPAHPLDHDCAQCQALAHLARCALPAPNPPCVAVAPAGAVDLHVVPEPRLVRGAAAPPPIRGPPTSA